MTGPAALEAVLAALVRGELPALYLLLDAEDRVLEANRHTRELLGPAPEGRPVAGFLADFEQGCSPAALAAAGPVTRQLTFLSARGMPQTYECRIAAVEGGTLLVGGASPAEEERLRRELLDGHRRLSNAGRDLQQANAELGRLAQLKDQFLAMASHDLRTPLSSVVALAQALEEELGGGLERAQREDLAAIRDAARLMRRMVDDFLDLASLEAGRLELRRAPASLRAVAASAVALTRPLAEARGVALTILGGEPSPVPLDPERAQRVAMNLLANAARHSPAGGVVTARVEAAEGGARLSVEDQGPGVPPDLLPRLFTPWVHGPQGEREGERRAGLGLAISRLIVEAHGGRVSARNGAAGGAVFEAWFPGEAPPA